MNYAFELQTVSKIKKTYAALTNAIAGWQADESCLSDTRMCPELYPPIWPGGAHPHNNKAISEKLANKLGAIESVYNPSPATLATIDWLPSKSYHLSGGSNQYSALYPDINNKVDCDSTFTSYLLLKDGTIVKIAGIWWVYNISFDINGKKPPNRVGKDQFVFSLYTPLRKSYSPFYNASYGGQIGGMCSEGLGECTVDGTPGRRSPLAYVLHYNKLPDLKAWGYPIAP